MLEGARRLVLEDASGQSVEVHKEEKQEERRAEERSGEKEQEKGEGGEAGDGGEERRQFCKFAILDR